MSSLFCDIALVTTVRMQYNRAIRSRYTFLQLKYRMKTREVPAHIRGNSHTKGSLSLDQDELRVFASTPSPVLPR